MHDITRLGDARVEPGASDLLASIPPAGLDASPCEGFKLYRRMDCSASVRVWHIWRNPEMMCLKEPILQR